MCTCDFTFFEKILCMFCRFWAPIGELTELFNFTFVQCLVVRSIGLRVFKITFLHLSVNSKYLNANYIKTRHTLLVKVCFAAVWAKYLKGQCHGRELEKQPASN